MIISIQGPGVKDRTHLARFLAKVLELAGFSVELNDLGRIEYFTENKNKKITIVTQRDI